MKKGLAVGCLVLAGFVMAVTSCAGSAPAQRTPEMKVEKQQASVFLNTTETADYRDIAAIAIEKGKTSGVASYSVDRYKATSTTLTALELGTFAITGTEIKIDAGKYHFVGKISEKEIVIGDLVYTLQ